MLLIIDGNSILNRAFYGIRPLTARDGLFTHAVYGFLQILESIRKEISPDAVAVAFDVKRHNFRHELYEGYKGSRKGMPEELAVQLPYCKQVLEALGCTLYGVEGYEADDIIGTFAAHCRRSGEQCVIATGDRDSLQLVGDGVSVRLARTSMGKAESALYDEARIGEEYGVTPSALIDIKALMGDSSDEIPGVAGIGQKTACQLIADFGSLDGVYENLDDARIRPAVRTKLENGREMAYLSRKLGTICCEVPVEIDLAAVKAKQPDRAALKRLLVRLEFFKMIDKYGLTDVEAGEAPSETPS
ncbi:MAG: DNA polymerase I, partial [Clostridia bacterium]|nr:DNA polymerase I [Clostridia bacterium]